MSSWIRSNSSSHFLQKWHVETAEHSELQLGAYFTDSETVWTDVRISKMTILK